jgi:hypothetical protein
MTGVRSDQRGITSGMLNLSRNLGLITGASVMGAVFWLAAGGTSDITTAAPDSVATAMRITFVVAAALILAALAIAAASRPRAPRDQPGTPASGSSRTMIRLVAPGVPVRRPAVRTTVAPLPSSGKHSAAASSASSIMSSTDSATRMSAG